MSTRAWGTKIQSPEEKFEQKRQAVLRTAAGLFRTKGVENTALGDIAHMLNVSKPTVYYYFRNKEEVLLALIEAGVAEFIDPNRHPEDNPSIPQGSGAQRFERFLRRVLRILFSELGGTFPTAMPYIHDTEKRKQFAAAARPINAMAESILLDGIGDGSIAPCNIANTYHFVVGALRYIPSWQRDERLSAEQVTEDFVSFVMRSLKREAS